MRAKIFSQFVRNLLLPLKNWGKLVPVTEIDQLVPKSGMVYDLGCDRGFYAQVLAKTPTRMVIGVDNNKSRLGTSHRKNLKFVDGDIRRYGLKGAECVLLIDVLHHLSLSEQDQLLTKIYGSLKENGLLLVKEVDTQEAVRSKLSRFWDLIFFPHDQIHYRDSGELTKFLSTLGLEVVIKRPSRLLPGSTTLYICTKK